MCKTQLTDFCDGKREVTLTQVNTSSTPQHIFNFFYLHHQRSRKFINFIVALDDAEEVNFGSLDINDDERNKKLCSWEQQFLINKCMR